MRSFLIAFTTVYGLVCVVLVGSGIYMFSQGSDAHASTRDAMLARRQWFIDLEAYHHNRKNDGNYSLESYEQAVMLHNEAIVKGYPDETVRQTGLRAMDEAMMVTLLWCEGE